MLVGITFVMLHPIVTRLFLMWNNEKTGSCLRISLPILILNYNCLYMFTVSKDEAGKPPNEPPKDTGRTETDTTQHNVAHKSQ